MKKFTLIICTYMRAKPLLLLLESVNKQTVYPNEILVIDGSTNIETEQLLKVNLFGKLKYFKVDDYQRGLTKQRNFGIKKVQETMDIVCFLDDDIVLEPNYFENLLSTYISYPEAIGVGGYIKNDSNWKLIGENGTINYNQYSFDGWVRKDGSRFVLRKKLGLDSNKPPAYFPDFGHGRSVSFLPPSGKTYQVEQLMGGVSSFPKKVLDVQKFSEYFEGYGLYEDADYTLRLSKKGNLYVNTSAQLDHYHEDSGRPNQYQYGKMVIRNGWYVWRVKWPKPSLKARFKWNATALLLTFIRFTNIFTTNNRKEALTETLGRVSGWFSLLFNRPRFQ